MDEPAPASDSASTANAAGTPPGTGPFARPASRGFVLVLALAFAAIGGLAWFDMRDTQRSLRTEVAKRLTDADAALAQSRTRDSDLANELREAQAKLALLDTRLGESQTQQASLDALYRELAPSRDELALNEVEQVLSLASQQLAIAGNVQAALAALQLADAKLSRYDRPQLVALRRALARDIDKLKSVPYVDVAGMSLKLDQVIATIDTLPLAKDERLPLPDVPPPPADEPAWLRSLRDAWSEVKALVRVEVSERAAAPLVPPEQQYFLRENLRLRLLTARVALLSHEDGAFKSDVTAANAWIKRYFDMRAKPVQGVSATLAQLAATAMPSELPDLSASLTAVRTLKSTRERSAERAGRTSAGR
jgi:uroporphyrin-3 C-methyltransferase